MGNYREVPLRSGMAGTTALCCEDCGALVRNTSTHDRFHDILNDHAAAIAVLLGAHLSERTHGHYDVNERVAKRTKGNNWSAEAFAEVVSDIAADTPTPATPPGD